MDYFHPEYLHPAFVTIELTRDALRFLVPRLRRMVVSVHEQDLDYDPTRAIDAYARGPLNLLVPKTPIGTDDQPLPYDVVFRYTESDAIHWGSYVVDVNFNLPAVLLRHRASVIEAWKRQGRLPKGDRPSPRVSSFSRDTAGQPIFKLQQASYYQQVATNLTLDRHLAQPIPVGENSCVSVREWDILQAQLAGALPSFDRSRLANTIGVAVGITARSRVGTDVVVICRRQRGRVGVYQDMWHLPLSFALDAELSNEQTGDMRTLVRIDYGSELSEELRLERSDLSDLRPLVFCRDLIRGGKPQFFLEAKSRLSFEQLKRRARPSQDEYRSKLRPLQTTEALDSLIGNCSPELVAFLALKMTEVLT